MSQPKSRMKSYILPFLAVLCALIVILIGSIRYKTGYAKTEIDTYVSDSGEYQLTIYEIGEPDWPFGSTHCRFVLYRAQTRICTYNFDINDDGARAHSDNFSVSWQDDSVSIVVHGSEQADVSYTLSFDGTVT